MAQVKFHKFVAALPVTLEADSIYYVRVGAGFDIYVTNSSGTIVAYSLNATAANGFQGKAIIDFGVNGSDTATAPITGQTTMVSASVIAVALEVKDSADHSADEHFVEEIEILAGSIVAGTGFTIYARTGNKKLYGKFNVAWSWR